MDKQFCVLHYFTHPQALLPIPTPNSCNYFLSRNITTCRRPYILTMPFTERINIDFRNQFAFAFYFRQCCTTQNSCQFPIQFPKTYKKCTLRIPIEN